ncbi:MAG TPA: MlaD family protein [Marmoricola sp.]|nr:MlaD family protein [Marmoricola sp.]
MIRPTTRNLSIVLAMVLAVVAVFYWTRGDSQRKLTVYFDHVVGVYVGSDVRVMGMKVGSVTAITPEATDVRVDLTYGSEYKLPIGVKAVIVAPSVISDRFIQLTPGYVSGPVLASGAVVPKRDTAEPIELDQSLKDTTNLLTALGPNGANAHGALSSALASLADMMRASGGNAHATLQSLAAISDTLSARSPQFAASITNLASLATTLAKSNNDVTAFNQNLAQLATSMAGDSTDLSALLETLATSLGKVATFVTNNRGLLVRNLSQLRSVTGTLASERAALAEVLDIAPLAFTNLIETYDSKAKAVRTRANFSQVANIIDQVVCDALTKQLGAKITPLCLQLHTLLHGGTP